MNLPSKKFMVIVGSAFVALGSWWIVLNIGGEKTEVAILPNETNNTFSETASIDSDNDGLKNWEEELWGTDPNNADTDGDGTIDGKEVLDGRDPTIAGPDDSFKTITEENKEQNQERTFSGKVAEDFVSSYFGYKGLYQGAPLPRNILNEVSNEFSRNINKELLAYQDTFNKTNFTISDTTDVKTYLNTVGSILDTNFKMIEKNEIEIVTKARETGNPLLLKELDKYMLAYQKTATELKNVVIPTAYADLHAMLINSMQNTYLAVENFQKSINDPLRSVIGVELYAKETARAAQYLTQLKEQVNKDDIAFTDDEEGAFFNQYFAQIQN